MFQRKSAQHQRSIQRELLDQQFRNGVTLLIVQVKSFVRNYFILLYYLATQFTPTPEPKCTTHDDCDDGYVCKEDECIIGNIRFNSTRLVGKKANTTPKAHIFNFLFGHIELGIVTKWEALPPPTR